MESPANNSAHPLVSVIIPCFNATKYIGLAIESALNQTYKNLEIIIINDGSTDNSEEIIQHYQKLDNRLIYLTQQNQGVSLTRNRGIETAKGDLIAFLDSDDAWEPENLEIKVKELISDPEVHWVFSDMYLADESFTKTEILEGVNTEDILDSLLLRRGEIIHAPSGIVLKKECFTQTGIRFDPRATPTEDLDLCIRISAKGYQGKYVPGVLWTYRVLSGSLSRNLDKLEAGNLLIMNKAANEGIFRSFWFKQHCFSNNYLILAGIWWVNGNKKLKALSYILKSILYYPPNLLKVLSKLKPNLYQAKRTPLASPEGLLKRNRAFKIRINNKKNVTTFLFHRVNPLRDPLWNPIHPEHFEQIIVYLKKHFEFVALRDYILNDIRPETGKPLCAIGFDDGYRDFLEHALPILKKYDCPSSMYVVTDCIDKDLPPWTYMLNHYFINTTKERINLDTRDFPGHLKKTEWKNKQERLLFAKQLNPYMKSLSNIDREAVYEKIISELNDVTPPHGLMLNWEEIKSLKDHKCEVGSHTVSHPVLSKKLTYDELIRELKQSGLSIEKHTGSFPDTISYPFGAYNDDVKKASLDAGYRLGVTVNPEPYDSSRHDTFEVPRIELFDEPFLKTKLRINEIVPRIVKILSLKG